MFLFRAVFWFTVVLLAAPYSGPLGLSHANGVGTAILDSVRANMLTNLNRVKVELTDARPNRGVSQL